MPTTWRRWTEEDILSLIEQVLQGKLLPDLRISRRTNAAINNKLVELRSSGQLKDRPPRKIRLWNIKEIRTLDRLVMAHGLSAARVARLLTKTFSDRTPDSISQQMRRLHLGNPAHRKRAKSAHRLSKEKSQSLNAFLVGKGKKMTSEKVATLWLLRVSTIRVRRSRLRRHNLLSSID